MNDKFIRTSNLVQITKSLKGDLTCGTVEIITNGGDIADKELKISHSLELSKGSMGIFLCDLSNRPLSIIDLHAETNPEKLEGKFENQSFIRYWWNGYELAASDIWFRFDSLEAVYNYTELISGYNFIDCNSASLNPIEEINQYKINNNAYQIKATNQVSFYPQEIAGGINDTLTITGGAFGSIKGDIFLPNANDAGSSSIILQDDDIFLWNDSIIKFVVPSSANASLQSSSQYGQPVGSGFIQIFPDAGIPIIPTTPFKVKFSIINHQDRFPCVIAPWQAMNKKFTFHCDTSVAYYDNGNMKIVIEKAIKDWICLTGVDWELGSDITFTGETAIEDQLCIISLENYADTTNALARTYIYRDKVLNSTTTDSSFQIYELDMTINSDYDWFCDTIASNNIPVGLKDFYHVMLHEFGHAHGLHHVIDTNAIMHYSTSNTSRQVNLSNDLSCDQGGNWVANYTNDTTNKMYRTLSIRMEFDTIKPCSKILSILEFAKDENINIDIFPNPCSYDLNILFKEKTFETLQIGIYDINGRIISENEVNNTDNYIEDVSFLESGVYFIRVFSTQGNFLGASKFIKQ